MINGQFRAVYPSNTLKLKRIEVPKIKNYIGYNDKLIQAMNCGLILLTAKSGYDFKDSNKAKLITAKFEVFD